MTSNNVNELTELTDFSNDPDLLAYINTGGDVRRITKTALNAQVATYLAGANPLAFATDTDETVGTAVYTVSGTPWAQVGGSAGPSVSAATRSGKALVMVSGAAEGDAASQILGIDIDINGTREGTAWAYGLQRVDFGGSAEIHNFSITRAVDIGSAGTITAKAFAKENGTGDVTIDAQATASAFVLQIVEV
jgi:hypothetical protein